MNTNVEQILFTIQILNLYFIAIQLSLRKTYNKGLVGIKVNILKY